MNKAKAIEKAIQRLTCLKFFPSESAARAEIMRIIDHMASEVKQIEWLTDSLIDRVGEWTGTRELRGIFCSRFPPADGIEADATHCAFNASAGEAKSLELAAPTRKPPELTAGEQQTALCSDLPTSVASGRMIAPIRVTPEERRVSEAWGRQHGLI